MNTPRIIIAAPKSGSGKTVLTITLMNALIKMGKKVSAFKCGPDYIDPLYHKEILNIESCNLDLFFTDEDTTRAIFLKNNNAEISIIEGVMGLYDGIETTSDKLSTYHLAKTLKSPIILVIDAKGMNYSILAEISGFVSMDKEKLIKGIILNNSNKQTFQNLQKIIEDKFKILLLGYFPKQNECNISSRHLGLCLPEEINSLKENIDIATKTFSNCIDIQKILTIAKKSENINSNFIFPTKQKIITRIAVAKDKAFNFYYKDNLELLENLGAQIVYFSPLKDLKLPENIGGLLLGGGYPELYAKELSKNKSIIKSIQQHINKGLPLWAECGGFIYLHQNIFINNENKKFSLCGIIKGNVFNTLKLVRFGYITLKELKIKGHSFHYFESSNNGEFSTAIKPSGKQWNCGHNINGGFQGFPHLYYLSNIEYAKSIIEKCKNFKRI